MKSTRRRGARVVLPNGEHGTVVEVLVLVQDDHGRPWLGCSAELAHDESGAGPYRCPVCGLRAYGYEGQVDAGRPCLCTAAEAAWKDGRGPGRGMQSTSRDAGERRQNAERPATR